MLKSFLKIFAIAYKMLKKEKTKQELFCEEYIKDLNAKRAATSAGYSAKTAYSMGSRLLKNVEVQKKIQELKKERSHRSTISADAVISTLGTIAFTPITDVISVENGKVFIKDSSKWSLAAKQAVESVRQSKDGVAIKMNSKVAALEKLGDHLGLFQDYNQALATLLRYGAVEWTDSTETSFTFTSEIGGE
jgi:phage terminase small subunit